jgi:hypothetical protein
MCKMLGYHFVSLEREKSGIDLKAGCVSELTTQETSAGVCWHVCGRANLSGELILRMTMQRNKGVVWKGRMHSLEDEVARDRGSHSARTRLTLSVPPMTTSDMCSWL